jgi:hypothetical protein
MLFVLGAILAGAVGYGGWRSVQESRAHRAWERSPGYRKAVESGRHEIVRKVVQGGHLTVSIRTSAARVHVWATSLPLPETPASLITFVDQIARAEDHAAKKRWTNTQGSNHRVRRPKAVSRRRRYE